MEHSMLLLSLWELVRTHAWELVRTHAWSLIVKRGPRFAWTAVKPSLARALLWLGRRLGEPEKKRPSSSAQKKRAPRRSNLSKNFPWAW